VRNHQVTSVGGADDSETAACQLMRGPLIYVIIEYQ
jgi:hypothetical protein